MAEEIINNCKDAHRAFWNFVRHVFREHKPEVIVIALLAILTLVYFAVRAPASGPAPSWIWANQISGTGEEKSLAVATDATTGDSYVTGYFTSGSITINTPTPTVLNNPGAPSKEIFVAKFDKDKNPIWAFSVGGDGDDSGKGIAFDSTGTGNIYITGSFDGSVGTVDFDPAHSNPLGILTTAGQVDAFVAKYDATNGSFGWAESYGSLLNDQGNAVALDNAANVYITGSFTTALGDLDIFVSKYATGGGAALWTETASGSGDDEGLGIAIHEDLNVNVYVTGDFFRSATFNTTTLTALGDGDAFVAKYDGPTGGFGWAKAMGGAESGFVDKARGIGVDSSGNPYVTGIFKGDATTGVTSGNMSTVVGEGIAGYFGDGGDALSSQLKTPLAITLDSSGNIIIADSVNNRVRMVLTNPDSTHYGIPMTMGNIYTIAGDGTTCLISPCGDGSSATSAKIRNPNGVAVDSFDNLFIADQDDRIRMVPAIDGNYYGVPMTTGNIYTVAGDGTQCTGFGPCGEGNPATSAQLDTPYAVAVDSSGNIFITDDKYRVLMVPVASGGTNYGVLMPTAFNIYTIAGQTGISGLGADGVSATSSTLFYSRSVSFDSSGNIYIVDGHRIRKVNFSDGIINTIAGTAGTPGSTGDGGLATSALLDTPIGVTVDSSGNIFIADTNNHRIRKVNASDSFINTVAGNGTACSLSTDPCGDGGLATSAQLNSPAGVAVDGSGNIFIADALNNRIRKVVFTSGSNLGLNAGADTKVFVAKLNPTDGSIGLSEWAVMMGVAPTEVPALALDSASPDNNVYVSDDFRGTDVEFNYSSPGIDKLTSGGVVSGTSNDVFVAKLDSSGSLDWIKQAGLSTSASNVFSHGISAVAENDLRIAGSFFTDVGLGDKISFDSIDLSSIAGSFDAFLAKLAIDDTPPTVMSTNPANLAGGVPVNITTVTATFSEPMDPATINAATFTIAGITPSLVTYGGITATFTLPGALAYLTTYTATITTGAKDLSGNPLAANFVWSFTTTASGGSSCTPNTNAYDASTPACGSTTTGVNNCRTPWTKTGPACTTPPNNPPSPCLSPNTLINGVCTPPTQCLSPNIMINGVCTQPNCTKDVWTLDHWGVCTNNGTQSGVYVMATQASVCPTTHAPSPVTTQICSVPGACGAFNANLYLSPPLSPPLTQQSDGLFCAHNPTAPVPPVAFTLNTTTLPSLLSHWAWTCAGLNGGAPASCSATQPCLSPKVMSGGVCKLLVPLNVCVASCGDPNCLPADPSVCSTPPLLQLEGEIVPPDIGTPPDGTTLPPAPTNGVANPSTTPTGTTPTGVIAGVLTTILPAPLVNFVGNLLSNPAAAVAAQVFAVAAMVAGAIIALANALPLVASSLSELPMLPARALNLAGAALGIKKKKKWGIVFDAETGEPLDPVAVSLKDQSGREVAFAITGLDGRYGFAVEPGTYTISAQKQHYTFPSVKLAGQKGTKIYDHLYFGEGLVVNESGQVIGQNIPLDRVKDDESWNEEQKNKLGIAGSYKREKRWKNISNILFCAGLTVATLALIAVQNNLNIIIFSLYIVLFILLRIRILGAKKKGKIVDAAGAPLPYAVMSVNAAGIPDMTIKKVVADKDGTFYCLVANGNYIVNIEAKTGPDTYTKVFTSQPIHVTKGIIKKKFKITLGSMSI